MEIMKNIMNKTINLKYNVEINNEIKEMTYLELGIKLTTENDNIEKVIIILKVD